MYIFYLRFYLTILRSNTKYFCGYLQNNYFFAKTAFGRILPQVPSEFGLWQGNNAKSTWNSTCFSVSPNEAKFDCRVRGDNLMFRGRCNTRIQAESVFLNILRFPYVELQPFVLIDAKLIQ